MTMQDRFADTRSLPPVDDHQDWFLLRAEEEGGYTTLEFTRNYTSCDTRDRSIGVNRVSVQIHRNHFVLTLA